MLVAWLLLLLWLLCLLVSVFVPLLEVACLVAGIAVLLGLLVYACVSWD